MTTEITARNFDSTFIDQLQANFDALTFGDVAAYGAVGDGVTDDTGAIAAAVTAVIAAGGGKVVFGAGTYLVSSQILVGSAGVFFEGVPGVTYIKASFGNASIIKFYNATRYSGGGVRNISLYTTVAPATAGAAVEFNNVGDCYAEYVTWDATYDGILFSGDNRNCRAFNCGGTDVIKSEFHITGGGNQHIYNGASYFNGTATTESTVLIEATERADLNFTTSSLHAYGVNIKPSSGSLVQNVWIAMPDEDASTVTGIVIDPSAANTVVRNIQIVGGSLSANSYYGLHIKTGSGQVGDVWVSGVAIQSNVKEGILQESGRLHLADCIVSRNGSGAGQSGIRVGNGAEVFEMTGGQVGKVLGGPDTSPRPMSDENYQLYGISIDASFAGVFRLVGVDLYGNITGPISNASSATIKVLGCRGYKNSASGVARISNGTSYKTVTPGSLAESITDTTPIFLTCLDNPDLAGIETVWRGATTSTTFDIVTSPFLNTSADLDVAWRIEFESSQA